MLNKKSLVLSSLIRLVLAFIFLFFLIGCGTELYGAIFGSEASRSYNKLVDLIETIEYDYPLPHFLYLDEENAIIAFTKDSDKIDYDDTRWKSYFERPDIDDCKKGTACLCFCKGKFKQTTKFDKDIAPLECDGKLRCNPFDDLDFPSEIKSEEIGEGLSSVGPRYTFNGGFYIGRGTGFSKYIPTFSHSPIEIYIKKDRNNTIYISTEAFEISP